MASNGRGGCGDVVVGSALSSHVSTPVPFSCNEATPLLLSQSLAWFFFYLQEVNGFT